MFLHEKKDTLASKRVIISIISDMVAIVVTMNLINMLLSFLDLKPQVLLKWLEIYGWEMFSI